jgi:UDP-glucose 4-epimerase
MTILVTGGAGFIGSHVVRLLAERGAPVVIADDLSNGDASRNPQITLVKLDLCAPGAVSSLVDLMAAFSIETVIHLAALKSVDESVSEPMRYFRENILGLANVLSAMQIASISKLIFSSSAAVYGATQGASISEDNPTRPISPYGQTKLVGEWLIRNAADAFDLNAINLRYFNVAGAGWPELSDTSVLNLFPMVFKRLHAGENPRIFGDDYPTADGTCVRDYIHVLDLARAHVKAADYLAAGYAGVETLNVGTGTGSSVREVIDAIARASGTGIAPVIEPRRDGDPAVVVASPERIHTLLGWKADLGLHDMASSAWQSHLAQIKPT